MTRRATLLLSLALALAVSAGLAGCKGQPPQPASQVAVGSEQNALPKDAAKPGEKKVEAEAGRGAPPQPSVGEARRTLEGRDPVQIQKALEALGGVIAKNEPGTSAEAAGVLKDMLKASALAETRKGAATALGAQADKYVDVLIAATKDPDETVRVAAIKALGGCARGSVGEKKLEELAKQQDASVKSTAIGALTMIRAKGTTGDRYGALVGQLGIPDGDASAQAAIQLKLAGPKALPALENAIRTSARAPQRHAATMCVALICAGTNPSQAKFASLAMAELKGDAPPTPANPAGFAVLAYSLKDTDPATREIAAQGLGYLGDARAAPILARALKDPDVHVRRRAAAALVTTPAKSVQPAIEAAALGDRDATARRFAVEALGWIGDNSVVPALARACGDQRSADVRRYAAMQLGRLKDPGGLDALIGLFKDPGSRDPDEDVRWAAVKAVGDMRYKADERARDALVVALSDPAPQVSTAAESGLQQLGIAKRKMPGAK